MERPGTTSDAAKLTSEQHRDGRDASNSHSMGGTSVCSCFAQHRRNVRRTLLRSGRFLHRPAYVVNILHAIACEIHRGLAFVVDFVFFDLVVQQAAVDLQAVGGLCLIAAGLAQGFGDQAAFKLGESLVKGQ